MKLILLYGPPGVGKMTVGKLLSEKTGITLFHNHMLLNVVSDIFGFNHPARKTLEYEFRLRVFEEAAKADKDLITTTGGVGPEYWGRFRDFIRVIEENGGEIIFIQLTASKEEVLSRVESEERRKHNKLNTKEAWTRNFEKHPGLFDSFPDREHLHIDTTNMTPKYVAGKIHEELQISSVK